MGLVGLSRTDKGISAGLAAVLDSIGGIRAHIPRGAAVLLKPNLNGTEGYTNPDLVDALITILRDAGASEISIGEATFGDARMTDMLFRKTGYADLARRHGIPLHNLNASLAVTVPVEKPLAAESLLIAREAIEADFIINLPVMKVHYATGVTLALKNMKGVLVGDQKRKFHEIGLDNAIADLSGVIRPALNIIDATTCMERMGPRGGDSFRLDLLVAGADAVETDIIAARIMGFEPPEIRHLQLCMEQRGISPEGIAIRGESLESCIRPFRRARADALVPPAFTVRQVDACSSCMNAFLLSCGFLAEKPLPKMNIYMGTAMPEGEAAEKQSLAFGACANKMPRSFDMRIRGCPPYPYALRELMAGPRDGTQ